MKLQSIASICKSAVTLLIASGIILLCLKGIIPVYTILFLLVAGSTIRFLLKIISFFTAIFIVLILIGTLL